MRHLCATLLLLVGCKSEPTPPPLCTPDHHALPSPWSLVDLPSGGRICEGTDAVARGGNYLGIQHPPIDNDDLSELGIQYIAAFKAAGWSTVSVKMSKSIHFSADLSWVDGSHTIELSLNRPFGNIEVSARRVGESWDKAVPEAGSLEDYRDRATRETNASIKEALEQNVKARRR